MFPILDAFYFLSLLSFGSSQIKKQNHNKNKINKIKSMPWFGRWLNYDQKTSPNKLYFKSLPTLMRGILFFKNKLIKTPSWHTFFKSKINK